MRRDKIRTRGTFNIGTGLSTTTGGSGGGGLSNHSILSNLAYADAGHTGFLPATHLTDFTHANIATAFGWGNHAGLYDPAGSAAAVTPTTLGLVIGTNVLAYRTFNDSNWDTAYGWGDWAYQMGLRAPIANPTFTGGIVKINAYSGANALQIIGRPGDHLGYIEWFQDNGTTLEGAIYGASGRLSITDSAGNDKLSITTTGVGIGTTSPGSILHVGTTGWAAHQMHFSSGWTAAGAHATIGSGYSGISASGIMLGSPHIPYRAAYGAKLRYAGVQEPGAYWDLGISAVDDRFDLSRSGATPFMTIQNNGTVGIGTTAPTVSLQVAGTGIKSEIIQSVTAYSTGFAGDGYKMIETGGVSNFEVDELTVRGTLKAYELQINKIHSINGGMVISVANAKCTTVAGTTIYFDEGIGLTIPFVVDDYIRAQQFNGTGVAAYTGRVTAVNAGNIVATTISGAPYNGMELVQFGHASTAARQNLLYFTAADTNNPYIEGHAGVTAGSLTDATRKFRLGNLTGITDAALSPSGYGLYSQNVFLSGRVVATAGYIGGDTGWAITAGSLIAGSGATRIELDTTNGIHMGATAFADAPFSVTPAGALKAISGLIGGWTMATTTLTGTNVTLSNTGYISAGTGNDIAYMSAADGTYRFWAGHATAASAPFRVTKLGALTATGIAELGTASIDVGGYVTNVAMKGPDLWENAYNNNNSILFINRLSYGGGASYYRQTVIGDGKGGIVAQFTGAGTNSLAIKALTYHSGRMAINDVAVTTIATSALLDLQSNSKTLIVPRMTTAEANAMTKVAGMIYYDTTLGHFYGYTNAWRILDA